MAEYVYSVVLEEEDGIYNVYVPALGCATQGNTQEEALANAKEAISLWIEHLIEKGLPIPTDTTGKARIETVKVVA